MPLFPKRAAGAVIAAENAKLNGLPRASRKRNLKYVRRSVALREQRSAYVGMRKAGV